MILSSHIILIHAGTVIWVKSFRQKSRGPGVVGILCTDFDLDAMLSSERIIIAADILLHNALPTERKHEQPDCNR